VIFINMIVHYFEFYFLLLLMYKKYYFDSFLLDKNIY
jgi:hypothetical protein